MFHAHDGNASATLGLQLMQAQSRAAPWVDRHERARGPLPAPFNHGPVELLQAVVKLTESPHASTKLVDDAVIMLTYGASYLQDHYDNSRTHGRLERQSAERAQRRQCWKLKARGIQATWRSQRFYTHRLSSLKLDTREHLQTEVVELMERKRQLKQQDSIANLHNAPVEININQLQEQVVKYAAELAKRAEERRRNEDEIQRKLLREQRLQEEKRKRILLQRRKRHERACRRWNYFAARLLRHVRKENDSGRQSARQVGADRRSQRELALSNQKETTETAPIDPLKLLKQPGNRKFIRRFVTKAIARGVSRVVCAHDMNKQEGIPEDASTSPTQVEEADITTSTKKILRLGLLLCDLHFGIQYTGLYQRFFERAAREQDVRIEWQVFNCIKSQLPTKAQQRVLDGFLVAGGPNIGVANDIAADGSASEDDKHGVRRRRSSIGGSLSRKNRHFGRWRQRLLLLLRQLHSRKHILLGGMGLGHVLLAEALGGRIGMKEWEDGWSLLDSSLFVEDSPHNSLNSLDRRLAQLVLGVRYLHGEFVESMAPSKGEARKSQGMKSWKSPGDQSFVACFRDKVTLSMDGSPECSSFVFETLGEFYERDKSTRQREHAAAVGQNLNRRSSRYFDDDDSDEDGEEGMSPLSLDTVISLEEKKKRLGITDASADVARLFLDHFRRSIHRSSTSSSLATGALDEKMKVVAVVCSSDMNDVAESIVKLASDEKCSGVFMNATVSEDGHLVVTNPEAFQVVLDFERRNRSLVKRPSVGSGAGPSNGRRNSIHRPTGLTLQMLRDHSAPPKSGIPHQGINRTSSKTSVRLPSIRSDASTKSLGGRATEENDELNFSSRRELIRRPSTMRSSTPEPQNISVLTLSQALTLFAQNGKRIGSDTPKAETKAGPKSVKRIFIRFMDEECKLTHSLLPLSKSDLRVMWLRLIAAIRIANLPNDQVAIVSRHSLILEYIRRRQPAWTFVKDCRRSDMTQRRRLKKIATYATCADVVLLDQEFLLSNSAREIEVLIKKAHAVGLQVYVAPRDESPGCMVKSRHKLSPRKSMGSRDKTSSQRIIDGFSKELATKTSQSEHDTHVVGFMLLQFSGLHGVITSQPGAAIDAMQNIAAESETMQEVGQLFRDWQARDASASKVVAVKRSSLDGRDDIDDPEDFVFGHTHYDSDDSIPEDEIVVEMARQWSEHVQEPGAPTPAVLASGESVGSKITGTGPDSSALAPPDAPLRPLKPKTGDQVFGLAANFRHQGTFKSSLAAHFIGEGRSRLSSIGSFRAAIRQATPPQRQLPHQTSMVNMRNGGDDDTRSPELTALASSASRGLKPMSSRRLVIPSRR